MNGGIEVIDKEAKHLDMVSWLGLRPPNLNDLGFQFGVGRFKFLVKISARRVIINSIPSILYLNLRHLELGFGLRGAGLLSARRRLGLLGVASRASTRSSESAAAALRRAGARRAGGSRCASSDR